MSAVASSWFLRRTATSGGGGGGSGGAGASLSFYLLCCFRARPRRRQSGVEREDDESAENSEQPRLRNSKTALSGHEERVNADYSALATEHKSTASSAGVDVTADESQIVIKETTERQCAVAQCNRKPGIAESSVEGNRLPGEQWLIYARYTCTV